MTTTRSKSKWGVVGLFLLAVIIGVFAFSNGQYVYKVTEESAQSRLDDAIKKRLASEKEPRIESARIHMSGNGLVVDAHITGKIPFKRIVSADVHAVGLPDYSSGKLYFRPINGQALEFSSIHVTQDKSKHHLLSDNIKYLIKKKAGEFIERHDLDELTQAVKEDGQKWLVNIAEKGVVYFLTTYPVYTFKHDVKGFVIRAAVKKIEIIDGVMHITLSLAQVAWTINVAIAIAGATIGFMIFLIQNPKWGAAIVAS
jgi:hypothetical protein